MSIVHQAEIFQHMSNIDHIPSAHMILIDGIAKIDVMIPESNATNHATTGTRALKAQ
jgi:hypothetical protein